MIKFTDSILLTNNPNGTQQQLGSQVTITYNPTFIEEKQQLSNLDVQIRQFLSEIEAVKDDSASLNSCTDKNQRESKRIETANAQICLQNARDCSLESRNHKTQNTKSNSSITYRLYQATKKFKNHIQKLESQIIELKNKIKQNDYSNSKNQIIIKEQQNKTQINKNLLDLSTKLKYCKFQYYKMKEDNNKLFESIKQMRSKLQAQFQELYKSQIKNLQLELLLQKQRFEYEISQLHQKLNQANLTAAFLNSKPIESLTHECDLCKSSSFVSLKQENQQLKAEIEAMKKKDKEISSFAEQIQKPTKIIIGTARLIID